MEQEILQGSMKHIAERGIAAYCDDRIAFIEDINKASRITGAVRMEIMIAVLCLKGKARRSERPAYLPPEHHPRKKHGKFRYRVPQHRHVARIHPPIVRHSR